MRCLECNGNHSLVDCPKIQKEYEGARAGGKVSVIVKKEGETEAVTAPFKTWEEAEKWEKEQRSKRVKEWREKNPEKYKAYQREYMRKRRER